MTNTKHTKRALLASVLSLLLCISMLVGSTFAWFTDSASTTVNKIVSGKLDVDLEVSYDNGSTWKSADKETLQFVDKDENDLWEPGCTYELPMLRVVNKGNLALKYQIVITGIKGDAKLNEVIEWTYNGLDVNTVYSLEAGVASAPIVISGHMKEEANNDYQDLTIDGIGITVYATQYTSEYDSFDNQYDKYADRNLINVTNQEELNAAITAANEPTAILLADGTYNLLLKSGETPNMLNKDILFSGSKNAVMDLTGIVGATWHTQDTDAVITFDGVTVKWKEDNEGYQGFANAKKVVYKNCTIYGTQFMGGDAEFVNCVFEAANTAEKGYAVYGRGAGTLTFTGCTFNTDGRAIMLYQDQTTEVNVVLTDCIFTDNGNYSSKPKAVVETGDGQHKTSKFNITVNNCIAYGFDENGIDGTVYVGNKDNIPADRLTVVIDNVNAGFVFTEGEQEIDLSDKTIAVTGSTIQENFAVIKANDNSSAVISGNGTVSVNADTGVSTAIAVWARNGGDIVIEDGNYILERVEGNTNELELIYASDTVVDGNTTTITIKGGTFKCDNAYKTLNIHGGGAYNDAEAFIYVMGGTYWNFNPAADFADGGPEDDNVIVPEGYKVVSEERTDGIWYTVVAE